MNLPIKNTHIPHIEELFFSENPLKIYDLLDQIKKTIKREESNIGLFYKWDGACSVFFGRDENNQFFVANKSILNTIKDKKLCYSYEDILRYHEGKWSLINCLNNLFYYFKDLDYGNFTWCIQGDVLFTKESLSDNLGDYFFQPNISKYYVKNDELLHGKEFGIALHTCFIYDGIINGMFTNYIKNQTNLSSKLFIEDSQLNLIKVPKKFDLVDYIDRFLIQGIGKLYDFINTRNLGPILSTCSSQIWKSFNSKIKPDTPWTKLVNDIVEDFYKHKANFESLIKKSELRTIIADLLIIQYDKRNIIENVFSVSDKFDKYTVIDPEGLILHDYSDNKLYKIVNRLDFSARNFQKWNI